VVAKADDDAAAMSSSEYEKLLFGYKPNKPSSDTEVSQEPAVQSDASSTEDVAPASLPKVDTDAVATEPAAEASPVVAVAPAEDHSDKSMQDIFARDASAISEVKDSIEAVPVEQVAVVKGSSPDVPFGSDDFAVWSTLKSLDTAPGKPTDNDAGTAHKEIDSSVKPDNDAITSMQHLLQENSFLQKTKRGINTGMVSIKLHRSK